MASLAQRKHGAGAYAEAQMGTASMRAPHDGEDRQAEPPSPNPYPEPGQFEAALAEMYANDPEYRAWREAEARGTIGGW